VDFGWEGRAWFGAGWHDPELAAGRWFRWSAARDAFVHVLVSRAQPIRVHLEASLAGPEGHDDSLVLLWNDRRLERTDDQREGHVTDWLVPSTSVRRGQNTLTIRVGRLVSPGAVGRSPDTRLLGAAVSELRFTPHAQDPNVR
jgi:hypothetical protein